MVERLLPLLRYISPSIHPPRSDRDATPHHSPARSQHQLPAQYVLDDLDAQASSIATLQPAGASQDILIVRCSLVRLDIRCPAPVNRRGSWGDGAHLRSGIVTLDIHALHATAKQSAQTTGPSRVSFTRGTSEPKATVSSGRMLLFFTRVPGKFHAQNSDMTPHLTGQTSEPRPSWSSDPCDPTPLTQMSYYRSSRCDPP